MIGNGKKIIFIDDNKLMLNIIKKKLEAFGFDTVDVGDKAKYLFDLLNAGNKYDLILLDDMMPEITGTDTMEILKGKKTSELYNGEIITQPIVVITGNDSPADRDRYLQKGFDEYLGKEHINELEEVIKRLL